MSIIIPSHYENPLDVRQTQIAIKKVKDFFEQDLAIHHIGTGLHMAISGAAGAAGIPVRSHSPYRITEASVIRDVKKGETLHFHRRFCYLYKISSIFCGQNRY